MLDRRGWNDNEMKTYNWLQNREADRSWKQGSEGWLRRVSAHLGSYTEEEELNKMEEYIEQVKYFSNKYLEEQKQDYKRKSQF